MLKRLKKKQMCRTSPQGSLQDEYSVSKVGPVRVADYITQHQVWTLCEGAG